jgi:hypothetical protein
MWESTGLTQKAPPAPQIWGELDLVPPKLGGLGGLIDGYCVSPEQYAIDSGTDGVAEQ